MKEYTGLRGSGHRVAYDDELKKFTGVDAMVVRRLNAVLREQDAKPKREKLSPTDVLLAEFGDQVVEYVPPAPDADESSTEEIPAAKGGEVLDFPFEQ